jgi:hypothetical protein
MWHNQAHHHSLLGALVLLKIWLGHAFGERLRISDRLAHVRQIVR